MKKIKYREFVLLLSYAAILIPSLSGQVLCINDCDSDNALGAIQDCCCHTPQKPVEPSCCSDASSESTSDQPAVYSTNSCMCIDVPLDTREPHDTIRNAPAPLQVAARALLDAAVPAEDAGRSAKAVSPLTGDINNLHTVILLI